LPTGARRLDEARELVTVVHPVERDLHRDAGRLLRGRGTPPHHLHLHLERREEVREADLEGDALPGHELAVAADEQPARGEILGDVPHRLRGVGVVDAEHQRDARIASLIPVVRHREGGSIARGNRAKWACPVLDNRRPPH
jgi:hypothetical protein